MAELNESRKNFLKRILPAAAFIGGLCCFTPLALVLLGISTVSFAASLSNTWYGTYKWMFRGAAFLFLLAALFWYFYKKEKVCTIDEFKKKRRTIINFALIAIILAIMAYVIWLYVIVEVIGLVIGVWG